MISQKEALSRISESDFKSYKFSDLKDWDLANLVAKVEDLRIYLAYLKFQGTSSRLSSRARVMRKNIARLLTSRRVLLNGAALKRQSLSNSERSGS